MKSPIQIVKRQSNISFSELDHPVYVTTDLNNRDYTVIRNLNHTTREPVSVLLKNASANDLKLDFSEFQDVIGVDNTIVLLEINTEDGYAQIGIYYDRTNLRDRYVTKVIDKLLEDIPSEWIEEKSQLNKFDSKQSLKS